MKTTTETCSRCSPQTRRRLRLLLVPTWHTLQVVEGEPMRKERVRFLKRMEVKAESPVLWVGEGERGHPIAWSTHPGRAGAWSACTRIITSPLQSDSFFVKNHGMGCYLFPPGFKRLTCQWPRCRCRTGQGRSAWRQEWQMWKRGKASCWSECSMHLKRWQFEKTLPPEEPLRSEGQHDILEVWGELEPAQKDDVSRCGIS